MQEVAAYSTVAMTLGLVVARPRLAGGFRVRPYHAATVGVLVLIALGVVRPEDVPLAAENLWRPFVAIGAIMVMTDVALRVGLLDAWAAHVERRARTTAQLFALVFALGALTATALNNDAAILLLTPLVVRLVRRRFPDRPGLLVPFAFAVFLAAGVAPLPVSNPMNMVVADFAGIGFNAYAARMLPIAVIGWLLAYAIARRLFRAELTGVLAATPPPPPLTNAQRWTMALLAGVLPAYSIVGYFGGPVWIVAVGGAAVALAIGFAESREHPLRIVRTGVSWNTLAFLLAVLVLSIGLRNVGLVDHLAELYAGAHTATVGATSALGSAILNNHPMAHLNLMALEGSQAHGVESVLAGLIGGDLGPRLLPMGSLAGLLWLEMLRRQRVHISLRRFVTVGAIVTVPTLALSLVALSLM